MMKNTFLGIVVIIILFLAGMATDRYVIGMKCEEVGSDTTYIKIPVVTPADTVIIPPKFIVKKIPIAVNQDSLWLVAKKYWESYYEDGDTAIQYVAKVDTSFQDSIVSISAEFVSPMLLHPDSYFQFNSITVQYPEITTTVMKTLTFWDRIIPDLSIQAGFGYGIIHKQFDFYAGAGLSWGIDKKTK